MVTSSNATVICEVGGVMSSLKNKDKKEKTLFLWVGHHE